MADPVPETAMPDVAPRTGGSLLGYQPALDGMRAVAIVMVMLFHTVYRGSTLFQAGYLGVDAFFVLSGFLITALLLHEFDHWHRISLRNFYVRRGLRLLPLAAALVLAGLIANRFTAPGFAGRPEWQGLAGVTFYVANWVHLWRPQALGFMGHAWSLAIEEQFYLVWPPLAVCLLWRGARRWTLVTVAAGLALASATYRAYQWYTVHHYPKSVRTFFPALLALNQRTFAVSERVYYSSFTHADGLLIGCLLAVLLTWFKFGDHVSRRAGSVLALVGVVVVGLVIWGANGSVHPYFLPGWGLVVFEVAIAVVTGALVLQPGIWLSRGLANRPAVWIGRRSYGLYVIHGVVFSLLSHVIKPGRYLIPSMWALTFLLAALSFRFVERPMLRLKDRFQTLPARRSETPARTRPRLRSVP